jgi:arylsulfatase A-like enzyme
MINLQTHATPQNAINWLRGYYAHITAIDSQVGRMLEILERRGVMDNTLVVFTADHGSMLGSQGLVDKQVPFEESVGVPLIMRMKDKIPAGTREGMIGLVDLPVTVAGLLNLRFTEKTNGADLGAMVTAETPTGLDNCYLYDLYPCHQAFDKGMQAWRGIRTERYTYAVRGTGEDWLLFDNLTDPYQLHNLVESPDHREIREELRESLTRHVHAHDGFMNGNDYIRFTKREEEFDRSQTFFGRPILSQL